MKIIFYLLSFIIFFNFIAYSEERVDIYSQSGDRLRVALPSGYCDISNTYEGRSISNHLNDTLNRVPEFYLIAKIVFNLCDQEYGYPWGYILLRDKKYSSSFTQEKFNELESSGFSKDYLKGIQDKVNDAHDLNDADIEIITMGTPEVLWQDNNALIFFQKLMGSHEGNVGIEVYTAGGIVYKNYGVFTYIYELDGEDNPLKNAQLLLNAAKATKSR